MGRNRDFAILFIQVHNNTLPIFENILMLLYLRNELLLKTEVWGNNGSRKPIEFLLLFVWIKFTRNDMFDLWFEIISSWNDEVIFFLLTIIQKIYRNCFLYTFFEIIFSIFILLNKIEIFFDIQVFWRHKKNWLMYWEEDHFVIHYLIGDLKFWYLSIFIT